jgi:hypothetical protein
MRCGVIVLLFLLDIYYSVVFGLRALMCFAHFNVYVCLCLCLCVQTELSDSDMALTKELSNRGLT